MRGGGIPSGLTALLGKLGLAGGLAGSKAGVTGKATKGMEGKGEGDVEKGALLGDDGVLLTGLGYNGADRRSTLKNVAERANLERFIEDMKGDAPEAKAADKGDKGEAKKDGETAKKGEAEAKEARADGGAPEAKEAHAEEGRVVGHHEAETKEAPDKEKAAEAEGESGQQGREESSDEEDKPGAGWLAEELEGETDESAPGARKAHALGETHRCRGTLEDGHRCLRKPVSGTSYCREHYVPPIPRPA